MKYQNYDRLVVCEGKSMTARMAAIKTGLAPSTVLKLHLAGKPIVKQPARGKNPRRALHNGQMLTAEEIAKAEGLAAETVRARMRAGLPLGRIKRQYRGAKVVHEGREWMVSELARKLGMSTGKLYYRVKHGLPLEGPLPPRASRSTSLTDSGTHRIARGEGENGLYWCDDLEARIWHLYCGGDEFGECTLAEIAALWGLSRERVRQVQDKAIGKIRRAAQRGDHDALDALKCFRLRLEQLNEQRPGHWECAELNAPGHFNLTSWHESVSMVSIAKKFGHVEYESQPHVRASYAAVAAVAARKARGV